MRDLATVGSEVGDRPDMRECRSRKRPHLQARNALQQRASAGKDRHSKDPKNHQIRQQIIKGTLSPKKVVKMTPKELASDVKKAEREQV